ncbi:bifunctional TH2 protein, mitochondrial isoform X2 [Coffea arabica]|uniref:Bifunctional TH2 protein, mitochondrial isoform X2 n=1 Tax=Coffea arabica TaxID=13443 RepID=A0A6P6UGI0_COFAR|nr:bifunctional TH2 protein, mitochondrial [Coffea arabica]
MRLLFQKPAPQILIRNLNTLSNLPFFNSNSFFKSSVSSLSLSGPDFSRRRRISSSCPMATVSTPKPPPATTTTTKIDDGVGIASKCWIKYRKESTLSLYSPFVVSLASGKLNVDAFRHYIAQDVYFLKAFAQAYELAEECADDDDAKIGINELRKNVVQELKMHNSFIQEWETAPAKESTLNPATLKYTEFLLATASGKVEGVKAPGKLATPFEKTKVAAYTLGAMTPCMRLYAFLGKELQALLDESESTHPYKKWIDNYYSDGFQASALQTEDLLDKLSVSLTGEELDIIEKLYHQAMKLELDFFLAQPLGQKTVVPLSKLHKETKDQLIIFSDFDLTCTVVDSSAILAQIAIITAQKSDQSQLETQIARMSSADLRSRWGFLSKQYTEEYEQCIESILVSDKADKFDYERLRNALEQLSDFEKRANLRVIESGVLKGLNLEDIRRAGERLILQDGCINFFKSITGNKNLDVKVHILSYCWCADLIRSAFSAGGLNALNVHANEFTYENSLSTGEIVKKVESPIDKLKAFSDILQNSSNNRRNLIVYIGDSVGDLLCLLEADVGIVLGSSTSLRRVGSHFGVTFVPLFPGVVEKQKGCVEGNSAVWTGLSGILYTVTSWAEISAFILGQ